MHISIFTPSYNKPVYVKDAILSVLSQGHKDFTYYIIENSTDEKTKKVVHEFIESFNDPRVFLIDEYPDRTIPQYVSSVFMNKYLEQMTGAVVWLSDDDYLLPNALQKISNAFDSNPEAKVVYWGLRSDFQEGDGFVTKHIRYADKLIPVGMNVDCMLDGGQISHLVECVEGLEKPYWREIWDNDTAHCDGIFFNRLVEKYPFYPINEVLSVKRTCQISNFTNK